MTKTLTASAFLSVLFMSSAFANTNPARMACRDGDTKQLFSVINAGGNVYSVSNMTTGQGYVVASDIFQDQYPLFITSKYSDADGKWLISETCKVSIPTSGSRIEAVVLRAGATGFEKVQCLSCESF